MSRLLVPEVVQTSAMDCGPAVLKSALGNAEFKDERDMEDLYVSEARIDGGPMFKRIQTRARGMAYRILKRLAHIHVTVSSPHEEGAN